MPHIIRKRKIQAFSLSAGPVSSFFIELFFRNTFSNQVLKVDDVEFLRMAGDRGWASATDIEGGGKQLFTDFPGQLVKDT